jgi:hypothetical protein
MALLTEYFLLEKESWVVESIFCLQMGVSGFAQTKLIETFEE